MLKDASERFARQFVHQWLDMQLLIHDTEERDPLLKESLQAEPVVFLL